MGGQSAAEDSSPRCFQGRLSCPFPPAAAGMGQCMAPCFDSGKKNRLCWGEPKVREGPESQNKQKCIIYIMDING